FSTLVDAQKVYPHATSLSDEIDWCALQAAYNTVGYNSGITSDDIGLFERIEATQVWHPMGVYVINKELEVKNHLTVLAGQVGAGYSKPAIKPTATGIWAVNVKSSNFSAFNLSVLG